MKKQQLKTLAITSLFVIMGLQVSAHNAHREALPLLKPMGPSLEYDSYSHHKVSIADFTVEDLVGEPSYLHDPWNQPTETVRIYNSGGKLLHEITTEPGKALEDPVTADWVQRSQPIMETSGLVLYVAY